MSVIAENAGYMDALLVGAYPPPHGGQSVHIRSLCRYLRRNGLNVCVYNTGMNKNLQEHGVVNISSSRSLLTNLLCGARFKVLHVHVATVEDYGKLVPVALAALFRRFAWMVTVHSGNTAEQLRSAKAWRRTVSRKLLMRARKIVCVNPTVFAELATLAKPHALTLIPPYGADTDPAASTPQLDAFFANHEPVITSVGFYEPDYGFDHAIRLMERVRHYYPNAGLALIGDLKGAEPYRALIAERGLTDHVKLCGNLEHDECLTAMKRSTLFLRATRYDGDSLSVREALALGVPTVVTATDFRPAGVVQYEAGVFEDLVETVMATLRQRVQGGSTPLKDFQNFEQLRQLYLGIMNEA